MTKSKQSPVLDADKVAIYCRSMVAMQPQSIDSDSIRAILADAKFRTLPDVAKAFEVSTNTVNQSWRQASMPGTTNNYIAADVLIWLLDRDIANRVATGTQGDSLTQRKREIEVRRMELDLLQAERAEQNDTGKVVSVEESRRELIALILTAKNILEDLPRSVAPIVPAASAEAVQQELTRGINGCLTFMAEGAGKIIGQAIEELRADRSLIEVDATIKRLVKGEQRGRRKHSGENRDRVGRRGATRDSPRNDGDSSPDHGHHSTEVPGRVDGSRAVTD